MYLTHNGTVRITSREQVRNGNRDAGPVRGMLFSYQEDRVAAAIEATRRMDGVHYVRAWLNQGELRVGDDLMYVLVGCDTRPHAVDALQYLVGRLKTECVEERELLGSAESGVPLHV